MSWVRKVRKFLKEESGAAIIEFALVVPLLLALVWGIIETGRAFYTVNTLASSVRDGARFAATCDLGSPAPDPDQLRVTGCEGKAKLIVASAFQPMGAALDTSDVTVSILFPDRILVEATYEYAPMVPVAGWQTFPMIRRAVFRYERLP